MEGFDDWFWKKVVQVCRMHMRYPHECAVARWVVTAVLAMILGFRNFYFKHGSCFVTYIFGVFAIFYLEQFLIQVENSDTWSETEFKLPEPLFWFLITVIVLLAFVMTFFSERNDFMSPCQVILFWSILIIRYVPLHSWIKEGWVWMIQKERFTNMQKDMGAMEGRNMLCCSEAFRYL